MNSTLVLILTIIGTILWIVFLLRYKKHKYSILNNDQFIGNKWIGKK